MELMLARDQEQATRTLGRLYVDGRFECYTVEDVRRPDGVKVKGETAIPAGCYKLALRDSPRFGKDALWLLDVPGFEWILIHAGNTEKDTEGCLIVGRVRTATGVGESRLALQALRDKLLPLLKAGVACQIRVLDVPRA